MLRFFIRVTLVLFIIAAGSVIALMVSRESNVNKINRNIEDTKASTVLTGHFVEHLITERMDKLYQAANISDIHKILPSLVSYVDYVATTYGHKGSFTIGLLDSDFKVVSSFNSSEDVCSQESIISKEISDILNSRKVYIGPASKDCIKDAGGDESLMMLAVSFEGADGKQRVIYEVSNLLDYINNHKYANFFSDLIQAKIFKDDISLYERGSEEYELLELKNSSALNGVASYNGNIVGFYYFYISDVKMCLVYIRDIVKFDYGLSSLPVLERYKSLIFISPVVLFILWVILEIVSVNDKLGKEVRVRTRHLEDMQKRYQNLFETIPEHVVLFKHSGEIIECNGMFAEMFDGEKPSHLNLIDMIREKERFKKILDVVDENSSLSMGEFLIETGTQHISVSVNVCQVELDGERAILAVMTDISKFKSMQEAYFLTQKKEVIGTLAAGMVHDFSNILQNISLQFSLFERSSSDSSDKNMANMRKILEGANGYLSGVLRYTKDTKSDIYVKSGSEFVKNSIVMLERVLPAEVKIRFEDKSGGMMIKAGQVKITQMLRNLCQNAADAMDGKGEIVIEAFADEKPFGNFFKITVADTGIGIKPQDIDNIYKPFFTTKRSKGTGIGLAAVRQAMMELGGFIEVESTPGEGTKFTLMFIESK
ncbi:MAG: hypothetical protein C0602_03760 [Denitrovibrio sp.]|nr:MAG: hypothetical protein C0602_03760 [Denitrovibrio sp.]